MANQAIYARSGLSVFFFPSVNGFFFAMPIFVLKKPIPFEISGDEFWSYLDDLMFPYISPYLRLAFLNLNLKKNPHSKGLNNFKLFQVTPTLVTTPGLTTHNDGQRFAYNDLLDFVRPEEKACHGYLRSDAQLMLLSPEGRVLLPPELSVLESLQSNGLTCRTVRRGWASTGISPR